MINQLRMPLEKPFVQTVVLMAIRASSLVVKFGLTLYLAKTMGFEEVGVYGLIAAGSIMAPVFLGLSLMYTINRKAVTQTIETTTLALRFYGRLVGSIYLVVCLVALSVGILTHNTLMFMAVVIVVLLEHLNNDFYNLLLNLSKPLSANFLHFLRTALWMLAFMGISYFTPGLRSVEFLLICWIIGGAVSLALFFYLTRNWPWRQIKSEQPLRAWIKQEFGTARTMYVNSVFVTISQYMSQFLITIFLGLELTGVYVFFMQIMSAMMNLLLTGVVQISRPKMVRAFKEQDPEYTAIFLKCMKTTVLIALVMAIFAWPAGYLVTHFINRPLAIEWFPVFVLVLTIFVLTMVSEVYNLVFYSQHRDDVILKLNFIGIIGGLILNTLLIPHYQLWGACSSSIIMSVGIILLQRRYCKQTLPPNIKNEAI